MTPDTIPEADKIVAFEWKELIHVIVDYASIVDFEGTGDELKKCLKYYLRKRRRKLWDNQIYVGLDSVNQRTAIHAKGRITTDSFTAKLGASNSLKLSAKGEMSERADGVALFSKNNIFSLIEKFYGGVQGTMFNRLCLACLRFNNNVSYFNITNNFILTRAYARNQSPQRKA